MKKSLVLLAILAPALLAADVASAAKSLSQCGSAFYACQIRCAGQKVFQDACFNRCESTRQTCAANATGGKPGKIQVGGNVVVTPTKSTRGSIPIQTGTTVVINPTPTRPTASQRTPCTVHCGPLGGRGKR
jgi:hypothetical protein